MVHALPVSGIFTLYEFTPIKGAVEVGVSTDEFSWLSAQLLGKAGMLMSVEHPENSSVNCI